MRLSRQHGITYLVKTYFEGLEFKRELHRCSAQSARHITELAVAGEALFGLITVPGELRLEVCHQPSDLFIVWIYH